MEKIAKYVALAVISCGVYQNGLVARPIKNNKQEKHAYKEITTKKEFTAEMAKNGTTVIKFHAPWCSFCKKMEPEFNKTAEMLQHDANFLSVNTQDLPEVADMFKVSSLPTTFIITKKTGFLSSTELEKEISKATGKASGMRTRSVPAPADDDAEDAAPVAKKRGKKS